MKPIFEGIAVGVFVAVCLFVLGMGATHAVDTMARERVEHEAREVRLNVAPRHAAK